MDELSSAFRNTHQFNETARVDRKLIDRVLRDAGRAMEFWLLGVLIDEKGNREAYTHNAVKRIDTDFFGTCYVAGSGADLIEKMIKQADHRLLKAGGWRDGAHISATEDLAENISCEMLYRESDYRNGMDVNTPIAVGCGGFYEWYAVLPQGIEPMRSRVDIHVRIRDKKLLITRIHFCEQMENKEVKLIDMSLPSQDYYLSIYNIGLKTHEIPLQLELGDWTTIIPEETAAVLIQAFFNIEDSVESLNKKSRLSASVSAEMAKRLFHNPVDVPRVRIIVSTGKTAITRGLISLPDEQSSAQIKEINGRVALCLSQKVMFALVELVAHLILPKETSGS
ncbi:hypothetical protein AFK24_15675 [Pseudomonas syringae]|uniref:Uncharacterized protein n=1 Tax=Pseudomonas syringae TaxID=317 RepID=A0A1C7Z5E2_PSESX|nr:hypothetical protein AFK24_15675 [Pseudomonas syringae]